MNKSDFWTGSLPRNNRRKVTFDDEPPARPPPPAPVRTKSLNYRLNKDKTLYDHEDTDEEHKVDLGTYKDPWVELYGKAVLDNTLQDRIEARRLKALHASPTQQFVLEQDWYDGQSGPDDYADIRNIVLKVLSAQGVPNPSDEVIDSAIKDHYNQKQVYFFNGTTR